jgi:hypothetical protein
MSAALIRLRQTDPLRTYQIIFSIVAEAHLSLAQTDCVFALADAVNSFKLCLVDALPLALACRLPRIGVFKE